MSAAVQVMDESHRSPSQVRAARRGHWRATEGKVVAPQPCKNCGGEIRDHQLSRAKRRQFCSLSCWSKWGCAHHPKMVASRRRHGSEHPNWTGGRYCDTYGYMRVMVDGRYVKEHRHIMERLIGRPLSRWESVHHINGKRDDNRPENLELWHRSHPSGVRANDQPAHCPTCTCRMHANKES